MLSGRIGSGGMAGGAWRDERVLAAVRGRGGEGPATPEERERAAFAMRAFGWEAAGEGWRPGPGAAPLPGPALLAEMVEEVLALRGMMSPEAVRERLPTVTARALARLRGREAEPVRRLRRPHGPEDAVQEALSRPFVGYFALEQHRLRHRRFDGGWSDPVDRLVFASGDAVTVLPYDPRRDAVLLIEQFRAAPFARRDSLPWCLEVVAGRCDQRESPEETARREAREEAGLELGRLERVLGYYPTPAIAAEFITAFVGEADLGDEGGLFGLASESEDIRAFVVGRAEAEAALDAGEVNNAPLALSLLWLRLNAGRLRQAWSG